MADVFLRVFTHLKNNIGLKFKGYIIFCNACICGQVGLINLVH